MISFNVSQMTLGNYNILAKNGRKWFSSFMLLFVKTCLYYMFIKKDFIDVAVDNDFTGYLIMFLHSCAHFLHACRRTACTLPSCRPSSRTPLRMPRTCRRTCCTSALRTRFPCTSSWMPSCTCLRSPCTSSCTFPSFQPFGCLRLSCIRSTGLTGHHAFVAAFDAARVLLVF